MVTACHISMLRHLEFMYSIQGRVMPSEDITFPNNEAQLMMIFNSKNNEGDHTRLGFEITLLLNPTLDNRLKHNLLHNI